VSQNTTGKTPLNILIADAAGTLLMGCGVAEEYAGTNFLPTAMQFDHYGLVMAGVGFLLMVPLLKWILQRPHRSQS
jgi:hypothetical protein